MPTYVYKFIDSGETIEVYQAFTDDPLSQAPHPSDGALRPVKKVFTPVGITFKGDGFYKTDSPKSTSSTTSPGDTPSTESTKSETTKSETSTAAATTAPSTPAPSESKPNPSSD
ncbi:MAG: FmdB family transcriptional regulator [Ilumatobacteraceae bacterium]|nr:FmdB family transcriptional regulator [Ilumatobacteraceae bacterium]